MARLVKRKRKSFLKGLGIFNILFIGVFIAFGLALIFRFADPKDLLTLFSRAGYDPSSRTFTETFNGAPSVPTAFTQIEQPNWDIAIHSRNSDTWEKLAPMKLHHGTNCEPPHDAAGNVVTHPFDGTYENAVFNCKDHVMTGINGIGLNIHDGYGLIAMTPNALIDFSQGEAVIKFDMSTFKAGRDWVDVWITPYDENVQLPFDIENVDLQGIAKNTVQFATANAVQDGMGFRPVVYRNFADTGEFSRDGGYNWWTGWEDFLTPSAQKRDTFEFRISKTHIKSCMPAYNFCWADKAIAPLNFDRGIVQFVHHSYTPDKMNEYAPEPCKSDPSMCANTWHWDNISISPSIPFTMIKGNVRMIDTRTAGSNRTVRFNSLAPSNAKLRFTAIGLVDVSFDGGTTWQRAPKQTAARPNTTQINPLPCAFSSYFFPIPQGIQDVTFRITREISDCEAGIAQDFAIWSQDTSIGGPQPTITQVVNTPTQAPIIPTPTQFIPTSTPKPTPTPTPQPTTPPIQSDTQAPTVGITSPTNGATVKRNSTFTIKATANDNVKVTQVRFYVNGVLRCSDSTPSFSCSWRVPRTTNITYTLTAKAYDAAGNTSTSTIQVKSK